MKKIISTVVLLATLLGAALSLTSCGTVEYCEYYKDRDISERDVYFVSIDMEDFGRIELGEIVLLLDATSAPATVENFLNLVDAKFYDGLTFHRIMRDFMIQGGDPEGNGTGGSAETIYGEFEENGYKDNDLLHKRGVISMARATPKNSASSQFFICNADSQMLDGSYAAFGYVIHGMSVVDKITDEFVGYTTNEVITSLTLQPRIKEARVLTKAEVSEYLAEMAK